MVHAMRKYGCVAHEGREVPDKTLIFFLMGF